MTLVFVDAANTATQVIDRVPQGEARREHRLRDLIHDHPGILPMREVDPSLRRLVTVAREFTVPGVGYVDVLLVDATGRLVVVECKLWRNPQARREVVGQILDYAREFSRWTYEDLQRQVSIATRRRGNVLFELASEAGGMLDEATFVDRVSRDLAAGRFLLLIAGDGITEGTRRIGEYLQNQPGLSFDFALVEFAEYRAGQGDGEQIILQPRILAQTVTIERHVIRSEVPGTSLVELETDVAPARRRGVSGEATSNSALAEAHASWRAFVSAFVAEVQFDDPGQLAARFGGLNWMRVPLPGPAPLVLYRSAGIRVGAFLKYRTPDGFAAWDALVADREAIDREFTGTGLEAPAWSDEEDQRTISIIAPSPAPWNEAREEEQRRWMTRAANQFVNSMRPRLLAIHG